MVLAWACTAGSWSSRSRCCTGSGGCGSAGRSATTSTRPSSAWPAPSSAGAGWNAYDPQQVAALCTDDVEWQQPSSPPLPRGYDGAALLVRQLQRACPDYRFAETEPPYASFDRRKAIVHGASRAR